MRTRVKRQVFLFVLFWAAFARAESNTVPFDLIDNRIFVDATLNGKGPYKFIFDTGANAALAKATAVSAGLPLQFTGKQNVGVGESQTETATTAVQQVKLGPVTLVQQDFVVLPMEDSPQVFGTAKVEGILGLPIFERWVVTIDYDRKLLTFADPKTYRPNTNAVAVPFERPYQIPIIRGELDGLRGTWAVDTGARTALIVANRFSDENHLRERYHATLEGITGWGIGGPVRSLLARAKNFRIGTQEVHDLVIRLSTQKAGLLTQAYYSGIVGPDVLRQFTVTFDYSRKTMYLEHSAAYGTSYAYDRSGMWMGQSGDAFEVLDVIPSGPADRAGVHKGDKITAIDGVPTTRLLLPLARERMRTLASGAKVRLRIGTEERVVTLRDLV